MTDDADLDADHEQHDEPASPEELAAAARLCDALEGRDGLPRIGAAPQLTDEMLLARALAHAFAPREIDAEVHERLLTVALAGREKAARRRWRGPVVVSLSLAGVLAMAASMMLLLTPLTASAPASVATSGTGVESPATLVPRSTEPLFVNERQGGGDLPGSHRGSARIDRIASARSKEYLQARLSRWGAR